MDVLKLLHIVSVLFTQGFDLMCVFMIGFSSRGKRRAYCDAVNVTLCFVRRTDAGRVLSGDQSFSQKKTTLGWCCLCLSAFAELNNTAEAFKVAPSEDFFWFPRGDSGQVNARPHRGGGALISSVMGKLCRGGAGACLNARRRH